MSRVCLEILNSILSKHCTLVSKSLGHVEICLQILPDEINKYYDHHLGEQVKNS